MVVARAFRQNVNWTQVLRLSKIGSSHSDNCREMQVFVSDCH